jgi:lipopolysaccharide export system permease protein
MGTLDRYIARLFGTNIVLIFVFLSLVIVGVDFSLNFDEFTKAAASVLQQREGLASPEDVGALSKGMMAVWLAADLWWPRLFLLFNYLLSPVLVGAMGFTVAYLVKHRELVAMLAGGVSLKRAARPVLVVTLAMVALMLLNREVVLPRLAPLLTRDKVEAGSRSLGAMRDFLIDGQGRVVYIQAADLDTNTLTGLTVYQRDEQGLMVSRLTAGRAVWREGAWALEQGELVSRRLQENAGPGTRVLPVPVSSFQTDMDPTMLQLRRFEGMAANLSTSQLSQLIARFRAQEMTPAQVRRVDGLERQRWGRFASAASCVLTVVVCLPFFLRKEPGNMLRQSLLAAPAAMGAYAGTLVGTTAAMPGVPASVGVFVPVVMLVPMAIVAMGGVRS